MVDRVKSSHRLNPYESPQGLKATCRPHAVLFQRFVVAIFAFFIAFWAGAIAIFICVVLHEKGLL